MIKLGLQMEMKLKYIIFLFETLVTLYPKNETYICLSRSRYKVLVINVNVWCFDSPC